MKLNVFKRTQILPINKDIAWSFFSNPKNLSTITPPKMGFNILSDLPEIVYRGLIIQYKVSPLLGIKMNWVTEITQAEPPHFFIDEQRFGPYKFWHHQHIFNEHPNGVEMVDIVHYLLPFGFLGNLFGKRFVEREIEKIFEYRKSILNKIFGE